MAPRRASTISGARRELAAAAPAAPVAPAGLPYLSLFGALLLEPARQSDTAPQLRRAASRGAARRGRAAGALGRPSRGASREFALAALTGPKRWLALRARGARARGKKRRAGVLGRRRRPRREKLRP